MQIDPVVERVRKARREICQKYDFDPEKIAKAIEEDEKNYSERLVSKITSLEKPRRVAIG
ncbi:hypothetical protein KKB18_01860 [bacterium]|nr:hypothetical protein [bacterium]